MLRESGAVSFRAKLLSIGSWTILRLPESASEKLPSRGMVMVEGTINGSRFSAPLEPDGNKSHWLNVDNDLLKAAKAHAGDTVTLEIVVAREWPEPEVPGDLKEALENNIGAHMIWNATTPAAHWDWIRWIRSTKNPETRKKRIEVACSKLEAGERRPCCFNRNTCTQMEVSKNGVLLESKAGP